MDALGGVEDGVEYRNTTSSALSKTCLHIEHWRASGLFSKVHLGQATVAAIVVLDKYRG